MSADEQTVVVAQENGSVFVSTDGGSSWQEQNQLGYSTSPATWSAAAATSDGSALYTADSDGWLWRYSVMTDTWTPLTGAGKHAFERHQRQRGPADGGSGCGQRAALHQPGRRFMRAYVCVNYHFSGGVRSGREIELRPGER